MNSNAVHYPASSVYWIPSERAWVGPHLQIMECLLQAKHCEIQRFKKSKAMISRSLHSGGKAPRWGPGLGRRETPSCKGNNSTKHAQFRSVALPLKTLPAAGVLPVPCVPSSLISLLCLSKAHTIHIISIQIQNLPDYCSECNVIQGFFFSERAPIWHAFLILCAICKCHHCSC